VLPAGAEGGGVGVGLGDGDALGGRAVPPRAVPPVQVRAPRATVVPAGAVTR
jgi:hypothetical protein